MWNVNFRSPSDAFFGSLTSQKVERAAAAQVLLRLSIYFAAKQPLMMGFGLSLFLFFRLSSCVDALHRESVG
jgi:hypothetical protein